MKAQADGRAKKGGWQVDYTIDDFGNITRRKLTIDGGRGGQDLAFGFENGSNRLISAPWGEFEYDGRGRQVRRSDGEVVDYTDFGLPKSITGPRAATFQYDAHGQRVEKRQSGRDFILYVPGLYEQRRSGSRVEHVFYVRGEKTVVAQVLREQTKGAEKTLYLHTDRVGSVDAVTDEEGTIVARTRRDPYGNRVVDFQRPVIPGVTPNPSKVRLGFTGK